MTNAAKGKLEDIIPSAFLVTINNENMGYDIFSIARREVRHLYRFDTQYQMKMKNLAKM